MNRAWSIYEQNQLRKWGLADQDLATYGEMPVEYITGHVDFDGLDILVNKDVLIPRVESVLMLTIAEELLIDRKEVVKNIEVYGEMHRYIPVIAKWAGFTKIEEKIVQHHERKYGKTKFGLERFINGFLDLMSISFVSKFGKRPMHVFGFLGTFSFLFGGFISFYLIAEKVYKSFYAIPTRDVTENPLFYLALVAMIIGTQLFLAGFLGELISRNSSTRNQYLIEKRI